MSPTPDTLGLTQYGGSLLEHALSSPLQPATSLAGSCCGVLPSLFGGAPADAGPAQAALSSPLPGAPCGARMRVQGCWLVKKTLWTHFHRACVQGDAEAMHLCRLGKTT